MFVHMHVRVLSLYLFVYVYNFPQTFSCRQVIKAQYEAGDTAEISPRSSVLSSSLLYSVAKTPR